MDISFRNGIQCRKLGGGFTCSSIILIFYAIVICIYNHLSKRSCSVKLMCREIIFYNNCRQICNRKMADSAKNTKRYIYTSRIESITMSLGYDLLFKSSSQVGDLGGGRKLDPGQNYMALLIGSTAAQATRPTVYLLHIFCNNYGKA